MFKNKNNRWAVGSARPLQWVFAYLTNTLIIDIRDGQFVFICFQVGLNSSSDNISWCFKVTHSNSVVACCIFQQVFET